MNKKENKEIKEPDPLLGKVFFKTFKLTKKIGHGPFDQLYIATSQKNSEEYAVKLELRENSKNLLETEAFILCHVKGFGVPTVKSFGYNSTYNVLVTELMGPSLEQNFQKLNKKFSLKTTCMIGIQMIQRIEWIHNKHIMHRDIKPENFVMGKGKKSPFLHILDFGLSKKFWSTKKNEHIPFKTGKRLTGTARYASISALKGNEQSRRDDLESIGYVLVYFLKGCLPWQGMKGGKKEEKYKKICDKKEETKPEDLCSELPKELSEYIRYTRNLGFMETPNYSYLSNLFKVILSSIDEKMDYFYDWSSERPDIDLKSFEACLRKATVVNENNRNLDKNCEKENLKIEMNTLKTETNNDSCKDERPHLSEDFQAEEEGREREEEEEEDKKM